MLTPHVLVHCETIKGSREHNCDAVASHTYAPNNGPTANTAMAIVDGVGNSPEVAETAHIAAEVIARTASRSTALAGIMSAHAMMADPSRSTPNAAAVAAAYTPGRGWRIAWVGDCRAYAILSDEEGLVGITNDHNIGEMLREAGYPEDLAARGDSQLRAGLSTATINTVDEAWINSPTLVILTSDGAHSVLTSTRMAALTRRWRLQPDRLAAALADEVRAAQVGRDHVDDATIAVAMVRMS